MAVAYFITFSTYGTWLHGTAKGNGSVDRQHNVFGTPFITPDSERVARAAHLMTEPPYVLGERARTVVRDAIVDLCREKDWKLLALHVRTNHVHAVISADREAGRLMSDLKSRASRDLNRAGTDNNSKRWTRHGSTRHLFDDASVVAAVAYTLDEQGPPMAVHDPRPQGVTHQRAEHEGAAHEVSESLHHSQRAAHEVSVLTHTRRVSVLTPHEVPTSIISNAKPTPVSSCAAESSGETLTSCAESLGNALTSCAAPPSTGGREIAGIKAYEE